jgi:hypothetical protein
MFITSSSIRRSVGWEFGLRPAANCARQNPGEVAQLQGEVTQLQGQRVDQRVSQRVRRLMGTLERDMDGLRGRVEDLEAGQAGERMEMGAPPPPPPLFFSARFLLFFFLQPKTDVWSHNPDE